MELDDLKQSWKQASTTPPENQNIMELIRKKSSGPVAALKQAFKRQTRVILVVMIAITVTNGRNLDNAAANIIFWTYLAFCVGLIAFFYINYRRTSAIENMDDDLRTCLSNYVNSMEKSLDNQFRAVGFVAVLFILLFEILPYFSHSRMLDKWHAVSPLVRFICYCAFFVLKYLAGGQVRQRKFGSHLSHLKQLLKEMN